MLVWKAVRIHHCAMFEESGVVQLISHQSQSMPSFQSKPCAPFTNGGHRHFGQEGITIPPRPMPILIVEHIHETPSSRVEVVSVHVLEAADRNAPVPIPHPPSPNFRPPVSFCMANSSLARGPAYFSERMTKKLFLRSRRAHASNLRSASTMLSWPQPTCTQTRREYRFRIATQCMRKC